MYQVFDDDLTARSRACISSQGFYPRAIGVVARATLRLPRARRCQLLSSNTAGPKSYHLDKSNGSTSTGCDWIHFRAAIFDVAKALHPVSQALPNLLNGLPADASTFCVSARPCRSNASVKLSCVYLSKRVVQSPNVTFAHCTAQALTHVAHAACEAASLSQSCFKDRIAHVHCVCLTRTSVRLPCRQVAGTHSDSEPNNAYRDAYKARHCTHTTTTIKQNR